MCNRDKEYWLSTITTAIKSAKMAPLGKAGETPLSLLADELEKLNPDSLQNAIAALVSLIQSPDKTLIETYPDTYWNVLRYLSSYIKHQHQTELRDVFFGRLFGIHNNDKEYWRDTITNTLKSSKTAPLGKAGETPLSLLADELEKLNPDSLQNAIAALVSLIQSPDKALIGNEPDTYWSDLCYLSSYIKHPHQTELRNAFYGRLFGKHQLAEPLLVYALKGYIAASGTLHPKDFDNLSPICRERPIAWLDAAARCGHFKLAEYQAKTLLENNALNVSGFIFGLDMWANRWNSGDAFSELVNRFRDATPQPADKDKFAKWLERRGYPVIEPTPLIAKWLERRRCHNKDKLTKRLGQFNIHTNRKKISTTKSDPKIIEYLQKLKAPKYNRTPQAA